MALPALLFVCQPSPSPEEQAAWDWLRASEAALARQVHPDDLIERLPGAQIVWWHSADEPRGAPELRPEAAASLGRWIDAGGRLWLTLQAVALLRALGLEDEAPQEFGFAPWQHEPSELTALEGERRGLISFGPHPVYDGLHGGVYLFKPQPGRTYPRAVYTARTRGRMVAAEWQYLAMHARRRLMLEYAPGAGRVLAVGAHLLFGERPNPYRAFLDRFARNCLGYLPAEQPAAAHSYWPGIDFRDPGAAASVEPPESRADDDPQWDVTGRRVIAVGRERGAVTDIWSLPLRLAHHVRLAAEATVVDFQKLPDGVARTFRVGDAVVAQKVSATASEALLSWEVISGSLPHLDIEFDVDLRWFWPYPEGVLGEPSLRRRGGDLLLLDGEDTPRGAVRLDPLSASVTLEPMGGDLHVRVRFGRPARVAATFRGLWHEPLVGADDGHVARACQASNDAETPAPEHSSVPPGAPWPAPEAYEARSSGTTGLTGGGSPSAAARPGAEEALLRVETPDAAFNEELFWTLNGLKAFDLETPAGRGLVAGLAETAAGWWSGRLGYAWYFGRDAMWSSMGCLAAGLREPVRESLRLLARYQQLEGKIFHELTPTGIAHFDAADSTPLFLLGLERYVRWTGDVDLVRELWPAAERALAFCLSTDRDQDGLIENTGVGHGWSEAGPIYGAHATFYLNACWAAALGSTAYLAELMGQGRTALRCEYEAARVKDILNRRFYRPEDGWFAYGIERDGSLMPARTVEPAVAAMFRLLKQELTERFFKGLCSPRFSTPWGVRYIARDDPAYDPRGYHYGSVWPLFTGWAAAAEYAYGRPESALQHVRASLGLIRERSFGVIDEVVDGDQNRSAGVCPHQLWSHAMTVTPVAEGLLGISPDAVEGGLSLRPQLPPNWDFVRIRGLRVGGHTLSFSYERTEAGLRLAIDAHRGPGSLRVAFVPAEASDHARCFVLAGQPAAA